MSSELYAILAMAARYWFIALILLIALRAWRMTVKDSRRAKLLRDWSPETGCVGPVSYTHLGQVFAFHVAALGQPQQEALGAVIQRGVAGVLDDAHRCV